MVSIVGFLDRFYTENKLLKRLLNEFCINHSPVTHSLIYAAKDNLVCLH